MGRSSGSSTCCRERSRCTEVNFPFISRQLGPWPSTIADIPASSPAATRPEESRSRTGENTDLATFRLGSAPICDSHGRRGIPTRPRGRPAGESARAAIADTQPTAIPLKAVPTAAPGTGIAVNICRMELLGRWFKRKAVSNGNGTGRLIVGGPIANMLGLPVHHTDLSRDMKGFQMT